MIPPEVRKEVLHLTDQILAEAIDSIEEHCPEEYKGAALVALAGKVYGQVKWTVRNAGKETEDSVKVIFLDTALQQYEDLDTLWKRAGKG